MGLWGQNTSAMLILAGAVSIVLSSPVFLGFFFGLNLPEVRRNTEFHDSLCRMIPPNARVRRYRHCVVEACQCQSPSSLRTCATAKSDDSSYFRYDVSDSTMDTVDGPCRAGTCCLQEQCDTCQECEEKCTGEDKECSKQCKDVKCNCSCVKQGSTVCSYTCSMWAEFWAAMLVKSAVLDIPGTEVEEVVDYKSDAAAAQARTQEGEYAANSSHTCLLHEDWRPSTGRLDEDDMIWPYEQGWTPWQWAVMGVFASWMAAGVMCVQSGVLSSFDSCPAPTAVAFTVACWCGVVVPLCILLPISFSRAVEEDESGDTAAGIHATTAVLALLFAGIPLLVIALLTANRACRRRLKAAQVQARRRQSAQEAAVADRRSVHPSSPYRSAHAPVAAPAAAAAAAATVPKPGGDFDPYAEADKAHEDNMARYGAPGGLV